MKPRWSLAVFLILGLVLPALGNTLDVVRRLDLSGVLGPVDSNYQIPALAHDGKDLWLVNPAGDHLLQVEPVQGTLVAKHKISGYGPVVPAGMSYGADHLWLLDSAGRALLQLDRKGKVKQVTPLVNVQGQLLGIDFIPPGPGRVAAIYVALKGPGDYPPEMIGFVIKGSGLVASGRSPLPLEGARSLATTLIDDVPYAWISAPRSNEDLLEDGGGDADMPGIAGKASQLPPDDAIPRGGMDRASSHRVALTNIKRGTVVGEAFIPGPCEMDMATDGKLLFLASGNQVAVASFFEKFEVELGACVYRQVKFYYREDYNNSTTVDISLAAPYDATFGPPDPQFYVDGTGGYQHQEVLDWLSFDPPGQEIRYTEYTHIGYQWLTRQGVHFLAQTGLSPEASYEIALNICSAKHNVLPEFVGPASWIPSEIMEMYTYDGDGDGYGDDNPDTCVDDFYGMNSATVHQHLMDSGAMDEDDLYYKVRKIHEYVTTRHVYSGADKHWTNLACNPSQKLESPYATCSSSAFMVVALAREAGIPARIVGTSIQRDSDLQPGEYSKDEEFHRWAQVYLPPYGWVRVDSTPTSNTNIGFRDVNWDAKIDECDICLTDAQCQADFSKSFTDCNISTPFTNPNDDDGDGDIDGDDIEAMGSGYWTAARIDAKYHQGVSARDLITIVQVGWPSLYLERRYVGAPVSHIGSELTCNTELDYGKDRENYVQWYNPAFIIGVFVGFDPSAKAPATVHWQTQGPFDQGDLVRIDLYQRFSSQNGTRYKFLRHLAHDVPAFFDHKDVDLGDLPNEGDIVVAVTRQGGPYRDRFSTLPQADWETFGVSPSLPLK